MTTEVLRNMLYAGSRTLLGPRLRGDGRGALPRRPGPRRGVGGGHHPPAGVGGAGLAVATVSNAEEFGEWLETVRGDTTTIVEEQRPVPLYQHVMVGRRLLDLFATSDVDAAAGFVKEGAPVNDELIRSPATTGPAAG